MTITRRRTSQLIAGLPLLAAGGGANAQDAPQVIVSTYAGLATPLWKKVVTDPFTKETGIKADVFASPLPSQSVAQAQGKPQFDLALVANYGVPGLIARNLVELLTPDDLPGIRNVPEKLWPKTPDGRLMGMPVYFGLFGIAYNTAIATADDFKSWKSLLDPKWKGQISITRSNFLAAYDVQLQAKLGGGDEHHLQPGYDYLRKLIPQALNVYSTMASVESQLARGEIAAVPFYANEINTMRRNGDTEVAVTIPEEGGLILPYLLALPKGAPHPEAAKKLMNAVVEPRYQAGFAENSLSWPVNPKAELPPALQKEMGMSADEAIARNVSLDWWTVGANLEAETRRVDKLMQDTR